MDIILLFRPKNFQIKEIFKIQGDELVPVETLKPQDMGYIDYYFGGKLYRHIGNWPFRAVPRYIVPIRHAIFTDQNGNETECTDIVKKYQGPSETPFDFHVYVPRPHFNVSFNGGFRITLGLKWVLKERKSGHLIVTNIFGQKNHIVV